MKKKRKVIFPCMILFGLLTNTFTSSIPVFAAINSTNDSKETTLSTGKIRKKLNSTLNGELEKGGTESSSESRETESSTVTSTDSQTKSNETQSVTDNTTDTTDEKDSSIDSTTKKAAKTSLSSNDEDSKQGNKKVSNAVAPKKQPSNATFSDGTADYWEGPWGYVDRDVYDIGGGWDSITMVLVAFDPSRNYDGTGVSGKENVILPYGDYKIGNGTRGRKEWIKQVKISSALLKSVAGWAGSNGGTLTIPAKTTGNALNTVITDSYNRPFQDYAGNTLNLSGLDTSNMTSMDYMFKGCSKLTSITLSSFNTKQVTNMSHMFEGCRSLTSINLNSFDTSNVESMNAMFSGCSSLTSINLDNLNTPKLDNVSFMFENCSSLKSINLDNFNTPKLETMSYMFEDCDHLTSISLKNFNTANVLSMAYAFKGCSSLSSINLNNFNTSRVESVDHMFYQCNSLKEIIGSDKWTFPNLKNMDYMFCWCSSLEKINISNWQIASNLDSMRNTFYACNKLQELALSNWKVDKIRFMSSTFNKCSLLKEIDLSKWNLANLSIMSWAFTDCSNLESIKFGSGTPQLSTISNAFEGCTKLHLLDLSTFDLSQANVSNLFTVNVATPFLVKINENSDCLKNYNYLNDNRIPPIVVKSGENGHFGTLTTPQYAFESCYTYQSLDSIDLTENNPEIQNHLKELEQDLQANTLNYKFTGWKFEEGNGVTEIEKRMNGSFTAQWKDDVLTDHSTYPKEITFGNHDITYDDVSYKGEENGQDATAKIDLTDTRGTSGNGFSLKVSRTKWQGKKTGAELVGTLSFEEKNLVNSNNFPIHGGDKTIELKKENEEIEVLSADKDQSGGQTTMTLDNFQLMVPGTSKKVQDQFDCTVTWTLSDTP